MQTHKEHIPFVYKDSVYWSHEFLHCMAHSFGFFSQLLESLKSGVIGKSGISLMGCVNYLHYIASVMEFRRLQTSQWIVHYRGENCAAIVTSEVFDLYV